MSVYVTGSQRLYLYLAICFGLLDSFVILMFQFSAMMFLAEEVSANQCFVHVWEIRITTTTFCAHVEEERFKALTLVVEWENLAC